MRCRETCHHYLGLDSNEVPRNNGTMLGTLSPGTAPAPFRTQHEPQRRELHNAFSESSQSTFPHAQCSSARGYQACYTT